VGGVVLLAAAYCGAAKLGQTLRYVGSVSAIWPTVGVGIAAVYVWGIRWWPGVLLGEIVVNGELWLDRTFPIGSLLGQQTGLNGRRGEVPLARNMVRTEAHGFHTWREELAVAPTLRALRPEPRPSAARRSKPWSTGTAG
jgi:hypothetical protein